jgi:hypothetical protein
VNGGNPLPEGTTSVYVRHTDKKTEMTLVPFEEYLSRVPPPFKVMLATDDIEVVEKAKEVCLFR